MIENGQFTFFTSGLMAQTYASETYDCDDGSGGTIAQSTPCEDEGVCLKRCKTCKGTYPCSGTHNNCPGAPTEDTPPSDGSDPTSDSGGADGHAGGGGANGDGSTGGGGSTGGSGSSGGGGGVNGIPIPYIFNGVYYYDSEPYVKAYVLNSVTIAAKNKYKGYLEAGSDCLKNCVQTMANYGQTKYGSFDTSIKLKDSKGTYPSNYVKAFNEITRHLKANKLMVAGVDYQPGAPEPNLRNDGITDHFILISGAGFDAERQQFYISYIETARYAARAEDACDPVANRLYFDPAKGFSGASVYKKREYELTHIRPNF